jgi:hypothetical protein
MESRHRHCSFRGDLTADFEQKCMLFRESRGLGRHCREHLRLGPKLAPRFLGRQQPAALRNPNPAASLPPISESPQRRKAFTQTMGKIAKSRVDVGWANWLAATVLSQAKEANERVKTAQGAISPPLASLSPSSGSTNIAPTPSPEAQMMGAPPPAPPRDCPAGPVLVTMSTRSSNVSSKAPRT